jgi:hypothetical protein
MDGITETAGIKLRAVLDCVEAPAQKCIRLVEDAGGHTLKLSKPRPDDVVFEYGGRTVLAVDPQMAKERTGQKLDWEHGQFCFV